MALNIPFWTWFLIRRRRERQFTAACSPSERSIPDTTDTAAHVFVAAIRLNDGRVGASSLALTGDDAASFEIIGTALYLKAGTALDAGDQSTYSVAVEVTNTARPGVTLSAAFTLTVT